MQQQQQQNPTSMLWTRQHLCNGLTIFDLRPFVRDVLFNMENSIDPEKTAPEEQSDQGLHCLLLKKEKFSDY